MLNQLVDIVSSSKDAALVLSLAFNVILCGAVWRLWKSREAIQGKVTEMLTDLVKELSASMRLRDKE